MGRFLILYPTIEEKKRRINGKLVYHDPLKILLNGRFMSFVLIVADAIDSTVELNSIELLDRTKQITNHEAELLDSAFYNNYGNEKFKKFNTTVYYSLAELCEHYSKN